MTPVFLVDMIEIFLISLFLLRSRSPSILAVGISGKVKNDLHGLKRVIFHSVAQTENDANNMETMYGKKIMDVGKLNLRKLNMIREKNVTTVECPNPIIESLLILSIYSKLTPY